MRLDPLHGTFGFMRGRIILLEKYFVPSVSRHGCSKRLQVLLENVDVDIGVYLRLRFEPVDRSCALRGETNPRHLSRRVLHFRENLALFAYDANATLALGLQLKHFFVRPADVAVQAVANTEFSTELRLRFLLL